jgi:hypothetical protein
MGMCDDIGEPMLIDRKGKREELCQQVLRDERDEAVEEILVECLDIYYQAGGAEPDTQVTEDAIRAALKLAWERWNMGDQK